MQILCAVPVNVADYADAGFHRKIERPAKCPHCGQEDALLALGYYSRNVTGMVRGVMRIFVRRFRCRLCGKTVSILPSFAQPYRLVLNGAISEFFDGALGANSLSWLPLLKQYWNRFANWLPEIEPFLKAMAARSPPHPNAEGWWAVLVAVLGNLEKITTALVSQYGVTLFGRYRCHSPVEPTAG
jgi:hypothetical protein